MWYLHFNCCWNLPPFFVFSHMLCGVVAFVSLIALQVKWIIFQIHPLIWNTLRSIMFSYNYSLLLTLLMGLYIDCRATETIQRNPFPSENIFLASDSNQFQNFDIGKSWKLSINIIWQFAERYFPILEELNAFHKSTGMAVDMIIKRLQSKIYPLLWKQLFTRVIIVK